MASDRDSKGLGQLFVGGIIVWLAKGPSLEFNNDWQLYINTAIATELMFMATFLQVSTAQGQGLLASCCYQYIPAALTNTCGPHLNELLLAEACCTGADHEVIMITELIW